ncbi:uncharacterized protein N7482_001645 [Penicillium canariense]|uniref:Enoyl reductase (ER) domain-containing protein n=1 Tax=Penicillium canariense TaxID=189055 RepID=A0A9W9IFJ1_9EURO|nr:uncharacterized protein N7482_001645 [Penicillium canariense]KAJ5175768.1 hypothetical protein N7482_001645 [Penicillium canariense]
MIDEGHRVTSWPFVPGLDGAGVVEQVGEGVLDFAAGDRVLALFTPGDRSGSYQEYAVVQEKDVAKIPARWSFEDASTLGVCYLTGLMALGIGLQTPLPFLKGGPTSGLQPLSVLILGGSSAVGAATIQLLRLAVPECKIIVTSSPKHHAHIKDYLGADEVIDRDSASLSLDAKLATPGSGGVDAIIDAVGAGSMQRDIFEALDPGGPRMYAQVWTGRKQIDAPDGVNSILFRGRDLHRLSGNQNIMKSLEQLLVQGKYKLPLPVHKVGHGFTALERGLELMRRGVSGEKLVVSI